jgi:predicted metal-binding membrane protein
MPWKLAARSSLPAHRGAARDEVAYPFAAVRGWIGIAALLFVLAGLAWWVTAERMTGMDAGPGTSLGALDWFLGVWIVMMAAMMFPAVSPTVVVYAKMAGRRDPSRALLFTAGYLLLWGATGLAAYGVYRVGRGAFGRDLAWSSSGRRFAGGVLTVAALYELTRLKHVCLQKCRSPLGFLLGAWRDGGRGALEMGLRHAAWCVGCCWALMAALFALGVMSLAWMAVVAALITVEKTLPWRRVAVWGTTAVLLALALGLVAAPGSVPALVVPGGPHAMHAVGTMR